MSRTDGSPIAAARDPALSLVKLVPLSHFMRYDLPALKHSFLDENGAPLPA
ncbi:TNT antitoxin family protein (plasmid) [Mycolicibacterium crocinum]|uniref:TNT antitoxin family protein n=1 Tax=Mycolicibacterium crocinum TaxID=388459 RepID=A0ABY3TV04_9MYCO|nr:MULTISPECIES: Imm61 family immunity protein [Mycolicibacterium]ULN44771.1 TNT antitoxin family protein [Mycolicibacterium crocinum]